MLRGRREKNWSTKGQSFEATVLLRNGLIFGILHSMGRRMGLRPRKKPAKLWKKFGLLFFYLEARFGSRHRKIVPSAL